MPITTMRELARRIDQTFPNATTVPVVSIPWGDSDAGLMVDYEDDAFRIGVYGDLTTDDEPLALIHVDTADRTWAALEHLTENQPEGTDWAAWADHWCREIWPDVRDSFA
jgi:hypothetical protein